MANDVVGGGSSAGLGAGGVGAGAGADLGAIPVVEIETGLVVYGELVREVEMRVRGRVTKAIVVHLHGETMHVAVPVTDGVGKAISHVKAGTGWPMRRVGLYLQFGDMKPVGKDHSTMDVTWLPVKFPLPKLEDVKAGV